MDKTNQKVKIINVDFGFNPNKPRRKRFTLRNKNHSQEIQKDSKKNFSKNITSSLNLIGKSSSKTIKILLHHFNKIKWKVSRSIFLGRGVYFKYISNFSIFFIIIVSILVYSVKNNTFTNEKFVSNFSTVAQADEGVLYYAGSQSMLSKRIEPIKYTVQSGDTLSSIVDKLNKQGYSISLDTIRWANNIQDDNSLEPGMTLETPPMDGTLHVVAAGETLEDIAEKYGKTGTTQEEAYGALQEISDVNLLDMKVEANKKVPVVVEGQKLIIPGGKITPVSTPAPLAQTPPVSNPNPEVPQPPQDQPAPPPADPIVVPDGGGGMFGWPVAGGGGIVTQDFGPYHTALDIADASGPYLVAIGDGVVISTETDNQGGKNVVNVDFGNGFTAMYAHCADNSFQVVGGQSVVRGQILATMGCSGWCTGTHVHFVLYKDGVNVNPLDYISR